jgi:predicted RNase H-like nuclease
MDRLQGGTPIPRHFGRGDRSPSMVEKPPPELAHLGIDIPIGLLDRSEEHATSKPADCLGWPRRAPACLPAPCRAALTAKNHAEASAVNRKKTGRGLSQQAFHIGSKIKQVDDAMTPDRQQWAFEVHPEVCFWALNGERPMAHNKKTEAGFNERLNLLRTEFPDIQQHLLNRPSGVGKDDLLDAAAAAWTALRRHRSEAVPVCTLVACRSEFVTTDAAGGVRVFPVDRPSVRGVGVDVAS